MADKPPSQMIADDLRDRITAGEFAPGDRLPSERALARSHGVARNTGRQAIAILQAEGLVDAEHGRGVFVRENRRLLRLASDRYSKGDSNQRTKSPFQAEVERQGGTPRVEVPTVDVVEVPEDIATRLKLDPGETVVRRVNHFFADDELVQLVTTFIPADIGEGTALEEREVGTGGIYARLEEAGHDLDRFSEDITARMPTRSEVELFGVGSGIPMLEVVHTSHDSSGQPFEVTRFVLPADRHTVSYSMQVD